MTDSFATWLVDTFIWTAVLIALVLLVRRPVARHFGSPVAYALWALVLLRFALPPVVLPASMAPVGGGGAALRVAHTSGDGMGAGENGLMPDWLPDLLPDLLPALLLAVWLAGAALFLAGRAIAYRRMRRALLRQACPVGVNAKVRLVETPAVSAPVAFGVLDKVVALPPRFMAQPDKAARDLALAHELAHHRGHDLLANLAAQAVLALHWFNPLAWWGWRAMRRDQEAACDARVIAGKGRAERAAYAQVIAGFAAGDALALTTSMACPVLGEKSIIQRLRHLAAPDVGSRRRQLGLAAIAAGALALPLTASIRYAPQEPELAQARAVGAGEVGGSGRFMALADPDQGLAPRRAPALAPPEPNPEPADAAPIGAATPAGAGPIAGPVFGTSASGMARQLVAPSPGAEGLMVARITFVQTSFVQTRFVQASFGQAGYDHAGDARLVSVQWHAQIWSGPMQPGASPGLAQPELGQPAVGQPVVGQPVAGKPAVGIPELRLPEADLLEPLDPTLRRVGELNETREA